MKRWRASLLLNATFRLCLMMAVEFAKIYASVCGLGIAELRTFVPVEIFRGESTSFVAEGKLFDSDAGEVSVMRADAAGR